MKYHEYDRIYVQQIDQQNNKMFIGTVDKKLSCHQRTARSVVLVDILPIATQQCKK